MVDAIVDVVVDGPQRSSDLDRVRRFVRGQWRRRRSWTDPLTLELDNHRQGVVSKQVVDVLMAGVTPDCEEPSR